MNEGFGVDGRPLSRWNERFVVDRQGADSSALFRCVDTAPPIAPSLVTTPIIGTGSVLEDARSANAPMTTYVVTVRYEDGSYAFIEQYDEPAVSKGDQVRVFEGRVEPRND